jgi:hypothetical protein
MVDIMLYVGMIVIAIVGTLLHFVYEISHHNKFVAIFAAVNESTWEHIKICMTPTILWCLYDGYVYGANANYLIGKSLCLLTIMILIPILFYTYTAFTKKSILWVDVICFYITVICSELVFNYFINLDALPFIYTYLSCIILFLEIGAYMFLTFNPLKNFIFKDPISHKYGLEGHPCSHDHHHHH